MGVGKELYVTGQIMSEWAFRLINCSHQSRYFTKTRLILFHENVPQNSEIPSKITSSIFFAEYFLQNSELIISLFDRFLLS